MKEKMNAYCKEIRKPEAKFYGPEFHHVPRDETTWQLMFCPNSGPSELSSRLMYLLKYSTAPW